MKSNWPNIFQLLEPVASDNYLNCGILNYLFYVGDICACLIPIIRITVSLLPRSSSSPSHPNH